jgi:hypothetical protein
MENNVRKREPQMIQIRAFKEKEKEICEKKPQFDAQWKVPMFSG